MSTPSTTTTTTSTGKKQLPAHHDSSGKGFNNPWPSFHKHGFGAVLSMMTEFDRKQSKVTKETQLPNVLDLNRALIDEYSLPKKQVNSGLTPEQHPQARHDKVATTWLGHPSQWVGPKRITPPPCKLDDLPRIDIVVISHNHYDHLDLTTIQRLQKDHAPYFYVPLGNKSWFNSIGIKGDKVRECDWWDEHEHSFHDNKSGVKVICTPCQHFTGRSMTDHYKTLWASWVVETIPQQVSEKSTKVFFGGDTGYRYVPNGSDEDDMPHCPAFKEIGSRIGPFDLSMIPIGAYSPRWFMSPIHCSPEDAVRLHEDIGSKRSVGMHWGTWVLTDEDVTEPPRRLQAAMTKRGHNPDTFSVLQIGETLVIDA
ncbi:hypothetical protein EDD11_003224 [Mortierella claussenii]|nr:hypothetical protein EDD11_003224 [Mortierella claussenii]